MTVSSPRPRAARRLTSDQLLERLAAYRATGDRAIRDELVYLLTPLVRHITARKVRQLPAYVEMDDLASAGYEALIVSIERFDPTVGSTLEQYAWTRINGAILDELRRRDWAPRSLRRWERESATAARELRTALGRESTEDELAERMGCTVEDVRRRNDQLALAEIDSLDATIAGDDGQTVDRTATIVSLDRSTDPALAAEANEARARLAAAVAELPERERDVARMLYVEGRRLRDIGTTIGVSESRVCQIASAVRRRLRTALDDHAEMLTAVAA
jgi:RNA polymerase sigma factor for flagellar operon FliA